MNITVRAGAGECRSGRLLVFLSKQADGEPRFQVGPAYDSQQVFGLDLNRFCPGDTVTLDDRFTGYPIEHAREFTPGTYRVQALFNIYETFTLKNGRTVSLPPDRGEGQHWSTKPGNPFSKVASLSATNPMVTLELTEENPQLTAPADTEYVRHMSMRSELLSSFWGKDVSLGAVVLLPPGWKTHPQAHYPVLVWHDHYSLDYAVSPGIRETPPDPGASADEQGQQRAAYLFYLDWISGRFPHVIIVLPLHANPYYDDSYAVNSANLGPYGDAIANELMPAVERQFRGMGQGWARMTAGASTGGWEALASQVLYPNMYNGAFVMCPDPISFHAFENVDIYRDTNAYFREGPFTRVDIPALRESDGHVTATMQRANQYEAAIASHGRSGEQFDIWQAVFSPQGADGYPQPIFDKRTGVIDPQVAKYWRQHFDLTELLRERWSTLGPELQGKLHFTAGESDSFYLNNAVHVLQSTLVETQSPHSDATFDYGSRQPHCYMGKRAKWADETMVEPLQWILPPLVDHILQTAPRGADVSSWRY